MQYLRRATSQRKKLELIHRDMVISSSRLMDSRWRFRVRMNTAEIHLYKVWVRALSIRVEIQKGSIPHFEHESASTKGAPVFCIRMCISGWKFVELIPTLRSQERAPRGTILCSKHKNASIRSSATALCSDLHPKNRNPHRPFVLSKHQDRVLDVPVPHYEHESASRSSSTRTKFHDVHSPPEIWAIDIFSRVNDSLS